jgi:PAS domain S-box-containing protein
MTAEHLASTPLIDRSDVQRLIDELSKIYRWLFVTDARRHVLWMSPDLTSLFGVEDLEIGSDARRFIEKLPRPEQVFAFRRELRNRRVLAGTPLELRSFDGRILPFEVSVLKIEAAGPGGPLLVAIARPEGESARDAEPQDAGQGDAPDAVLRVDSGGFVSGANDAALGLTGRSRAELVGQPLAALFAGSVSNLERMASALRSESRKEHRVVLRSSDGRSLPVSVTSRIAESGDPVGVVLCIRDASERECKEAELGRAIEELEHCITSLAHDLRSPLVALLGFSRLLRQEYGEAIGETGRHFVDRIEEAGRTIEGLVHHVLELSRAGQPGERSALVDPREVLSQLRAELKPRLEEAGIELSLPEPAPPLLSCDRTRLYQLFSNLIGNAIEHMGSPPRPRIEVSVEEQGDAHLIVVRDNGRGIDPAHRHRIFEPFQSFGSAPRARGAGMGLAIVKKIVEKRGGRIWVESELGKGTAFHVRLPRR